MTLRSSLAALAVVVASATVVSAQVDLAKTAKLSNPSQLNEKAPATYKAKFETTKGPFVVEVHREWAPLGADRFYNLVKAGFYDDGRLFRVIPDFMVQFGINGNTAVQSKWLNANLKDDPVKQSNKRGYITFANAGPNSRSTQLFINLVDNAFLDPDAMHFAPFGQVVEGMDVVDMLYTGYGRQNVPDQTRITNEGNAYLTKEYPKLDYVKTATIAQ